MTCFRRIFLTIFILALPWGSVRAVDLGLAKEDAGQAGAFLDFAASARSLALGRAYTAVADDASAVYWNPSGLSQLDRKNFVGLYSVLQQNTSFGTANFAFPTIDYGTFGVGLVNLQSTDFEKRTTGPLLGTYTQAETGVLLSNGFRFSEKLSLGTTFKMVNQKIDSYSDTGYGADVGFLWTFNPAIQTGLILQNLWAPQLTLKSSADKYPRDVRLGFKYLPRKNILVTSDLDKTENRGLKLSLGSEWRVGDILALRAGLNDTELTAGFGFKFGDWGLDYAIGYQQSIGGVDSLGSSQQLGFSYTFGEKISDTGFSLRWQRKGKLVLELLKQQMTAGTKPLAPEVQSLVNAGEEVISHQGYNKAEDLYSAQGYISYFKAEFERSVQSLSEAQALDPQNDELKNHLEIARAHMTAEQTKKFVAQEMKLMKELYEKGDYVGAVASCEKVLSFNPDHIEAAAYLEDANRRLNEPILRELKIAQSKYEREEYLDTIKHLQAVKKLDPSNKEADRLLASAISALEKKSRLQGRDYKVAPVLTREASDVYEIRQDVTKSRQLYSQGLMLYSTGKLHEAVSIWEKAVKLDGDNQLARNAYNRGLAELQESSNP